MSTARYDELARHCAESTNPKQPIGLDLRDGFSWVPGLLAACCRQPGDVKPVGKGVSGLRIECGPGYRVYFVRKGRTVIVLLAGGDKKTQAADTETALRLARNL